MRLPKAEEVVAEVYPLVDGPEYPVFDDIAGALITCDLVDVFGWDYWPSRN